MHHHHHHHPSVVSGCYHPIQTTSSSSLTFVATQTTPYNNKFAKQYAYHQSCHQQKQPQRKLDLCATSTFALVKRCHSSLGSSMIKIDGHLGLVWFGWGKRGSEKILVSTQKRDFVWYDGVNSKFSNVNNNSALTFSSLATLLVMLAQKSSRSFTSKY